MKRKWLVWIVVLIVIVGLCLGAVATGLIYWQSSSRTAFNELAAPIVQIFYPEHGDALPFGSSIPVGAEAFVEEGSSVILLQLWADGQMIGEMTGDDVMLVGSWSWLPTSLGEHTLVARAYNEDEMEGTTVVNVNIEEIADADRDGVPDSEDECPDDIGSPDWNGCPPGGALGDAWAPAGSEAGDDVSDASVEEGLGDDVPTEDVYVEESEEVEEDPAAEVYGLEFEGLELQTSVGAMDTYCYLTLTTRDLERVPSDVEGNFAETTPGNWNAADYMAADRGRSVFIEEDRTLHVEMDCWGHFSALPADPDPRHLGLMTADHNFPDWNGTEFTMRGEDGGNWFDFTYRICQGSCETTTLPRPFMLHIFDSGPDYTLRWNWDGDPAVDNTNVGFHVYRDGNPYVTVHDNHPVNEILVPSADAEPPLCGQEFRFEVRAFRPDPEQLSEVSNYAWSNSPTPCIGDNYIQVQTSGMMLDVPRYVMNLDYFYNHSHTERVVVAAFPTIDGSFADTDLFSWYGNSVSEGDGSTYAYINYGGSEQITTTGMALFMLTVAEGGFPGGIPIYMREVPMEVTWNPGGADLRTTELIYPPPAGPMLLKVRNNGTAIIDSWEPAFAFFETSGGTRNRITDLDSPPGLGVPLTLPPFSSGFVFWPGWTPARILVLNTAEEMDIDPDNVVAEFNEANNTYPIEIPNVRVNVKTIRINSHGALDAAGFGGCFAGLNGHINSSGESVHFDGTGLKQRYPTFFNIFSPHELGVLVCPPQEFTISELFPALRDGSCSAAASNFFAAHAQPVFAEGKHIWLPIPAWGDDYSSACATLAGQTSASTTSFLEISYTPGDTLSIDVYLSNQGFLDTGAMISNPVCNFTADIPHGDMTGLPIIDRVLADPGGDCEIVVDIVQFP